MLGLLIVNTLYSSQSSGRISCHSNSDGPNKASIVECNYHFILQIKHVKYVYNKKY